MKKVPFIALFSTGLWTAAAFGADASGVPGQVPAAPAPAAATPTVVAPAGTPASRVSSGLSSAPTSADAAPVLEAPAVPMPIEPATAPAPLLTETPPLPALPPPPRQGLFGPVRVGPVVGAGILMGPNMGIESRSFRHFGLAVSYAQYKNLSVFGIYNFRKSINTSSDYSVNTMYLNYKQLEGRISYFPWTNSSFFLGVAGGKRYIALNLTGTVNAVISQFPLGISAPIGIEYNVNSWYVAPAVGWLKNWSGRFGGFAIGTDFGFQYTLTSAVTLNAAISGVDRAYVTAIQSSSQYTSMVDTAKSQTVTKLKKYPLPYWNIVKVGWLF